MVCTAIFTASWEVSPEDSLRNKTYSFDLQLFSGEKTEEPTGKRKEEARGKGQVAKSVEINSAFVILAGFFALKIFTPLIYMEIANFMRLTYSTIIRNDLTMVSTHLFFIEFAMVFLKSVLPMMLVIMIMSVIANMLQVGFNFTTEPIMPKLSKINPISGLGRLFSKRSLVELIKSFIKIGVIGYFIYRFISKETMQLPKFINQDLLDTLPQVGNLILDLAFQTGAVILVLAVLDYFYQWWEHNKSLKMSKHEVKQEFKQSEGDPQLKGKIKERQRAMAMQRMMQEIPQASVVVTNPTHYAVALRYEKDMVAPIVIAKGQDFLAQRIKELAKEHSVTIVENKPLARSLYSATEIGGAVPADLYQAVAEVLAYVYRLKKRLS